ncbi:hypothetical protein SeLEV6574_g05381 [Synchytrium endobioticum]|uniref:Uncharacterized protein n=1 Tax=Synchytrium endobioticum TaxID=286115 RepID=A0A507CUK1_9FUNG|nr:hypothetical protein SeLEV6574_g05381 [Synchytrium endobioticum]
MEQFTVTYKGYPSEPRSTTVDHSGTTYPITFLPNQARIQHAGLDVVTVPHESRIAICVEIRITGDQATVEVAPSSAFLRLCVNNQLVEVPISTAAIVCNHPQENFDISEELLVQTQAVDFVIAGGRKVVVNEGHVNVVFYLGLEAQRQAMPVLVVGDGEFGWRAPYRASPAKGCFKTAAAAGALVVFSPERYNSTFSSSMTKGMDFWSADCLPIYGPQVRLLDVTENAPRCNHRKKRRDFRSHEGAFPVSTAHKKTLYCYEDDGAGWPSHATSFCPDVQLVPSTVWRLKTDTSPALFVHPAGGVQDVQPQPRVIVHRDRNSRQHMNANFYSYCLTRGIVQEYMLPPCLHAAWTAVPPDEW